ncbi:MAG: alpha-hydroxy-acid oxidizing protein [Lawsonibacter sp.]|jgi:4-hydroxymandelate oxidase
MNYQQVLETARGCIGPYCKACPVCDGRACKNTMPGPGAKGSGTVARRNYDAWQEVFLNMDTITENCPVDTHYTFFGQTYELPIFAGPVGAVKLHYGDKFTDLEYNDILVPACAQAGIAAFTGDGADPAVFLGAAKAIGQNGGRGIPTVKPWDRDTVFEKLDAAKSSGAQVFAMDIDAAGLPFLKGHTPPAGRKTVEELREIITYAGVPFLLKGIMTVAGARKALEAGAAGIVVSNHGGRVLDGVPSTAAVLPAIARAVKGQMTILVDGGIRSGVDVCKALALGADACILARPYVTAVYGGGAEGVKVLTEKLREELEDTMAMCGVHSLNQISQDMIYQG